MKKMYLFFSNCDSFWIIKKKISVTPLYFQTLQSSLYLKFNHIPKNFNPKAYLLGLLMESIVDEQVANYATCYIPKWGFSNICHL